MILKRMFAILVVVFIIMACIPISAFAFDAGAAYAVANSMTQAFITYGAAHHISVMINEDSITNVSVPFNQLYDRYRNQRITEQSLGNTGIDPETPNGVKILSFPSAASDFWYNVYTKIEDKIGMSYTANQVSVLDDFYNWLLSGPMEMQKVDDQYYQWAVINGEVERVNFLYDTPWLEMKYVASPDYDEATYVACGENSFFMDRPFPTNNSSTLKYYRSGITDLDTNSHNSNSIVIMFYVDGTLHNGNTGRYFYWLANRNGADGDKPFVSSYFATSQPPYGLPGYNNASMKNWESLGTGVYRAFWDGEGTSSLWFVPNSISYSSYSDGVNTLYPYVLSGDKSEYYTIGAQPFIGDTAPQDVYIPNNDDVNYAPLPVTIPLDINWDDTLYGDGVLGDRTTSQNDAIQSAVSGEIVQDHTLTIDQSIPINPDVPAPNEFYIPFLPVTLPSFNFSLSGIWHYVREWISSLGAWFTMVLTVWSNLPYAMVVPVYATMVVLIVLGVYKRFFM